MVLLDEGGLTMNGPGFLPGGAEGGRRSQDGKTESGETEYELQTGSLLQTGCAGARP
jgi:hypothetical protein